MPCNNRKARLLLKEGKAEIFKYEPFTIRLIFGSYGYKQPTILGIDLGAKSVGYAVTSNAGVVLFKADLELRTNIKSLMDDRRQYRRGRRTRKLRYRKPRFLNRTRPAGWLPPTLVSKANATLGTINKIKQILPIISTIVEIANFDIQKIENPEITGKEYQQGNLYEYGNIRSYVFARDNYTCAICKKKDGILETHHTIQRSDGGTDRPDNLITLHEQCHKDFHAGLYPNTKFKKAPQYKEAAHVNSMKNYILNKIGKCNITYGYITKAMRKEFGLEKSHINDALAIAGIRPNRDLCTDYLIKHVRKKKRSLHEATFRKGGTRHSKNQKKLIRDNKNWNKHAKVMYLPTNQYGYITGFSGKYSVYVKDVNEEYLKDAKGKYTQLNSKDLLLINNNNNFIVFNHV